MGTFMVEVKIAGSNMTEADVKSGVDSFVKQYKDSGPAHETDANIQAVLTSIQIK